MSRTAETVLLTVLALLAFAANSLLTRLALGRGHIDAATFTTLRLTAGAITLMGLVFMQARGRTPWRGQGVVGPLALFAYAAPFSYAYLRIGAALGALVLFASVQITMLGWGILRGDSPGARTWTGLALALAGLTWLTVPAAVRPDIMGTVLMMIAGAAWGAYTICGRSATDPLAANARNFLFAVPMASVLALGLAVLRPAVADSRGIALAVISGAITSGLGYAIWYRALRGLTGMQAAILQLSVPVIAAFGAVVFLGEAIGVRLIVSGAAVLSGVALALSVRVVPARE